MLRRRTSSSRLCLRVRGWGGGHPHARHDVETESGVGSLLTPAVPHTVSCSRPRRPHAHGAVVKEELNGTRTRGVLVDARHTCENHSRSGLRVSIVLRAAAGVALRGGRGSGGLEGWWGTTATVQWAVPRGGLVGRAATVDVIIDPSYRDSTLRLSRVRNSNTRHLWATGGGPAGEWCYCPARRSAGEAGGDGAGSGRRVLEAAVGTSRE
jgi:hypothetical protein